MSVRVKTEYYCNVCGGSWNDETHPLGENGSTVIYLDHGLDVTCPYGCPD